jgi:hypothetical protein
MRELRRKAVFAYQFIPLRRSATPARHNSTVDTSERMHGLGGLPSAAPAGSSGSSGIDDRKSSGIERHRAASSDIDDRRSFPVAKLCLESKRHAAHTDLAINPDPFLVRCRSMSLDADDAARSYFRCRSIPKARRKA